MEQLYRHLLLTRFNVEIAYADPGRGVEDAWLRDRLEVFDRITVPSVTSQTARLDAWLVFVNANSPAWFRSNIEARSYLTPVWIDGPLLDGRIPDEVIALGLTDRKYLITSRVDNDDALAQDFVAVVQQQFEQQARLFVEFPNGLEYSSGDFFRKTWRSNPFMSLIESTVPTIDTVICRPHPEVRRNEPTRTIWRREMWLQNSHPFSATSSSVRNMRPLINNKRPQTIICEWNDDGGRLTRRLVTAIRSIPHVLRISMYRAWFRVD